MTAENVISGWIMFRRSKWFFAIALLYAVGASAAGDPRQLYEQSADALYNLDFSTAEHGYEALTHDFPDYPDYRTALASAIWLKITFTQQKLSLESFSGRSSFGTRDSHVSLDPADEERLRRTVSMAMAKADAVLKKNPDDVHALYAKGVADATLASFEGAVKRSYTSGLGDANAAKKLHQQVLKLDPNFDDARLSVGTYDYVLASVPYLIRISLGLFGITTAGKEAGIQQLETAAAKGKNSQTEAKMILSVIYSRERRYDDALRTMSQLHTKYPHNFLFELAEASTYNKMKRWDDAARIYQEVLAKIQSKKDGYDRVRVERVYYQLGNNDIQAEQFEAAVDDFSHVTSGKDASPDEKAGAHIWIGKILDSKKDRAHAVQQYEAVLRLDCNSDLRAEAQKYMRRPFGE
jgi:tetratricopeptide (TPR) repeat protein